MNFNGVSSTRFGKTRELAYIGPCKAVTACAEAWVIYLLETEDDGCWELTKTKSRKDHI